jgi:hypothetical protein
MSKRTVILLSVLLIFVVSQIYSQERKPVPLFATVHLGILNTDRENFSDNYGSNTGFVFGGGLGFQVSSSAALVFKATYFHKSGVPLIRTYSYNYSTGTMTLVSEKKEGTASYTQWLVNAGLQVSILDLNQFFMLGSGGILYSVVSEEQNAPSLSYSTSGKGVYGYFLGLTMEKEYKELQLSPFIELQYNFTRSGIINTLGHYGGINVSLGCKYSFHQ